MIIFTMRPRPGVVFQTQTARTIETIVRRSAPRSMGLSSPWGAALHQTTPATGKNPHFTRGFTPWDSLPDCQPLDSPPNPQHPVAWAYLARGVLHFIKPPPLRGKIPILREGLPNHILQSTKSLDDQRNPIASL
jgi:hypothetical protein